jgi:single-stranded DNA-binding protein|tara:strand:- start:501 stop:866 length:366 start_codon:yes stop_codon:yes gene_type:complete
MSRINAVFTGNVVAEPTKKDINGTPLLEFPVYVNHTKKDKDSGEYVKTGDTSKIRVTVWRDLANSLDVKQGDLVEIHGSLVEKEFDKKDGTPGRSLQTDYIESVVVKYRKDGAAPSDDGVF